MRSFACGVPDQAAVGMVRPPLGAVQSPLVSPSHPELPNVGWRLEALSLYASALTWYAVAGGDLMVDFGLTEVSARMTWSRTPLPALPASATGVLHSGVSSQTSTWGRIRPPRFLIRPGGRGPAA